MLVSTIHTLIIPLTPHPLSGRYMSLHSLAQLCAIERDWAGNRTRDAALVLCGALCEHPCPFAALLDLSIVDRSVCSLFHLAASNEMQSGTCWTCLPLQCMQAG